MYDQSFGSDSMFFGSLFNWMVLDKCIPSNLLDFWILCMSELFSGERLRI